jgi:hypothetical protein
MSNHQDDRLKKVTDPGRVNRAMQDRQITENREISDDERVEAFRTQFIQSALPDLPKIPGYHLCWLTTTNPRDSIHARMRMGYSPVKPEDVPGWEYASIKTGEWTGMIGVNEMLAFKIPLSLYEKYMREVHHNAPLSENEKLTATADAIREQAQSVGSQVIEGSGMAELRKTVPIPTFADEG